MIANESCTAQYKFLAIFYNRKGKIMIKKTYQNFGDYLKDNRKMKNMTAAQVADTIGVSRAEVSRIETGDRQEPSLRVLRYSTHLFGDKMEDVADFLLENNAKKTTTTKTRVAKKSATK